MEKYYLFISLFLLLYSFLTNLVRRLLIIVSRWFLGMHKLYSTCRTLYVAVTRSILLQAAVATRLQLGCWFGLYVNDIMSRLMSVSAASLLVKLDSDIAPRPSRLSDVTSTWLSSDFTSLSILARQCHHQHDSVAWCVLLWLAIWFGGSPPIKLRGLRSTTPLTAWLRCTFTYISDLDSRRAHHHHNVMRHFTKLAK
jgi:hypothetical protein